MTRDETTHAIREFLDAHPNVSLADLLPPHLLNAVRASPQPKTQPLLSKLRGGAREGAGRPVSRLVIRLPPEIAAQLNEIIRAEGRERYAELVLDAVRPALLDMIERWQDDHRER